MFNNVIKKNKKIRNYMKQERGLIYVVKCKKVLSVKFSDE